MDQQLSKIRTRVLFDWMASQQWAEEYSTVKHGIEIAISGVTEEQARKRLEEAGFGGMLWSGTCQFLRSSGDKYVETGQTPGPPDRAGCLVRCLTPTPKQAHFSGTIFSTHLDVWGMTVGHLLSSENDDILNGKGKRINNRTILVREVDDDPVNETGRLTADLCLFVPHNFLTLNELPFGWEKSLSLQLWKGDIECGTTVYVVGGQHEIREGKIHSDCFNMNKDGRRLYRTLKIRHISPDKSFTESGDSGSVIVRLGQDGDFRGYVVGIAIGMLEPADNGPRSTIAIRLYDVLRAIGKNPKYALALTDKEEAEDIMSDVDFF